MTNQDTPDNNVEYRVSNPPIAEGVGIREGQTIQASSYTPIEERTYSVLDVGKIKLAAINYITQVLPNRDLITADASKLAERFKDVPAMRTMYRLTIQIHNDFPEFFEYKEREDTWALYEICDLYCKSQTRKQ